ncbi:M15 family metallopeptidase [Microbacterium hydrocarbonoxydans]|uniref:M15 family metallopeptidase n=1 Tax=Microbacterium hydrocarbonoxydans TaxID=273678 RepID=UPI0013D94265|nr:M15 family metallopeptidase [Microbacterium hydrocarbonoxydans]
MNTRRAFRQRRLTATIGVALLAALILAAIVVVGQQSLSPASAADRSSLAPVSEADGMISEHDAVSVFADTPAVSNLDPELLTALRAAAVAAEEDGIRLHVNSGWRSPAYQEVLLADAVEKYGSAEEAARWVATPEKSEHVSGDAVDLGPLAGQDWMSRHGAAYGLCQIYANERWHYELRPAAVANGCPPMYEDPTADPRISQ